MFVQVTFIITLVSVRLMTEKGGGDMNEMSQTAAPPPSLPLRLWLQVTSPVPDGGAGFWGVAGGVSAELKSGF